jgi:hypothetical protein
MSSVGEVIVGSEELLLIAGVYFRQLKKYPLSPRWASCFVLKQVAHSTFLPRVFWGQNPGRCKPSKTSRCRIHWAVEVGVAVWACSRQRSNP